MRKKMAASFGIWLILILMIGAVTIFTNSIFGIFAGLLLSVLPVVSWGLNLYVRKYLAFQVSIAPTASKGDVTEGVLTIRNHSLIPVGKVLCSLQLHNRLTDEKQESILELSAMAKTASSVKFQMKANHCGYVTIDVSKVILLDWFGFLPMTAKVSGKGKISILPDTFASQVSLRMSYAKSEDADAWSPNRRGEDYTEVFALRDYVEGDSLKQIHWKLSSKRNQLIVKEASLPTTKSLLLFWDKNVSGAGSEDMDAIAEVVASVSQAVQEQGVTFTLGWTEGKECLYEDIETEEGLLQTIPRLLKTGMDLSADSGSYICTQEQVDQKFGKVIYFAKNLPTDFTPMGSGDMTLLIGNPGADIPEYLTYTFGAKTYAQDVQAIEL